MDKNLAFMIALASTFLFQDCEDEVLLDKLRDYFKNKGIDVLTYFDEFGDMKFAQALDWFITAADKLQECIEEYEALERED